MSGSGTSASPRGTAFSLRLAALLLALCSFFAAANAAAADMSAAEIEQLLADLGRSRCEFQRNGRWHDAAAAEQHLRRKYEWLRKRDLVGTPEQFIERAGTRSSITGRAYRVRCPGAPATEAGAWLRERLQVLRRRNANGD